MRRMNPTTPARVRDPAQDQDWSDLAALWRVRTDTIYLNHGSFGFQPDCVRYARRRWSDQLNEQPMDFYLRHLEPAIQDARSALADFVGTSPANLAFTDNSTYAMNVVANSFQLEPGDEILINDHEYGAVERIWQRACEQAGAKLVCVALPLPIESTDQVVNALLAGVTKKTRMVVFSHITSATALIMPAKQICSAFAERGIAVCVDGPHAPAQLDFSIDELNCDFYTASLHKWLCAALGSGFLYVHPKHQSSIEPPIKSWGRLLPALPQHWDEEFTWIGTRDPSPFLSVPTAIEFMQDIGLDAFRDRTRWLARYAEDELKTLFGTEPIADRSRGWYGSMTHVPLPPGDWSNLQKQLWEQVGIEVMIIEGRSNWYIRVSSHLYNNTTQVDTLVKALSRLMS